MEKSAREWSSFRSAPHQFVLTSLPTLPVAGLHLTQTTPHQNHLSPPLSNHNNTICLALFAPRSNFELPEEDVTARARAFVMTVYGSYSVGNS
jgi:hypothetical protein